MTTPAFPFKEMSAAERAGTDHNALMEPQRVEHVNPNSVELSRNAKGERSWSVKIYFGEDDPIRRLRAIDDELLRVYAPVIP